MSNIEELTNKDVVKENKELYRLALNTWGIYAQIDVAIEEMSELIKELVKYKRGKGVYEHMAEEIADVSIMLEQIVLAFNFDEQVYEQKKFKLNRLKKLLECKTID